jgi:hypothetical protein
MVNQINVSVGNAIEEIKDIHQLTYFLLKLKEPKVKLLKLNGIRKQILNVI